MLKPKKNSKFFKQKITKLKKKTVKQKNNKLKLYNPFIHSLFTLIQIKKILKNKNNFLKFFIKCTHNNIFCTLLNYKKIIKRASSTTYKLKITKKSLNYRYRLVISRFINEIKKVAFVNRLIVNLKVPSKFKKFIFYMITNVFKKASIFFENNFLKSFNGCRPPKKRRIKLRKFTTR